ncbi:Zinc finger, RING-type [Sesbania bispinosa]|nr:Zinc finger, RING-type [Sesbania bispinosa]
MKETTATQQKKGTIEEPTKIEKSSKGIRKFQKMSIKERLRKGFSCQICKQVMDSPVTTTCGHNFCKSCLEGAFAGQTFMGERNIGGRTLRSQKNVMKCPTCTIDISDYLQNFQVDIALKGVIESLKAKVEENGEPLEASEDVDRLQENGAEETSKATDSVVKHNAKRKKLILQNNYLRWVMVDEPSVQTMIVKDVHGEVWKLRHIIKAGHIATCLQPSGADS